MIISGKGYIAGSGNEFFGEEYETLLSEITNVDNIIDEHEFQLIYSLDKVENVNIVNYAPFELQNMYKDGLLKFKNNIAQIWFQNNKGIINTTKLSKYICEKINIYFGKHYDINPPAFDITIYNKDCFIQNHRDGYDSTGNRLCVVLLYLNKDWKETDGGELVIIDEQEERYNIPPQFGNFAILNFTDANLKHEVRKINSDTFNRKTLISFMNKNKKYDL